MALLRIEFIDTPWVSSTKAAQTLKECGQTFSGIYRQGSLSHCQKLGVVRLKDIVKNKHRPKLSC